MQPTFSKNKTANSESDTLVLVFQEFCNVKKIFWKKKGHDAQIAKALKVQISFLLKLK